MDSVPAHGFASDKKRLLLIALPIVFIAAAFILFYLQSGKNALKVPLFQKEATVAIKTEYKNPFAKETQYVNPFEPYKNVFVVSK